MCTIDLKHCCDETPGEQVRNYYRQQGYSAGFREGYDAGNGMMTKALQTAAYLERKRIINMLEETTDETTTCWSCNEAPKHCACNLQEDERTGN